MFKGKILDEFGEAVGRYWYREGSGTYTVYWYGIRKDGWTLEGIYDWANKMEYHIEEAR